MCRILGYLNQQAKIFVIAQTDQYLYFSPTGTNNTMEQTTHVLAMSRSLEQSLSSTKSTSRLKYNCMAVSSNLICLGASTGSVYLYDRSSLKLIRFISNAISGIVIMRFSSDEKMLAAADNNGVIIVWDMEHYNAEVKIVREIVDYKLRQVTSMCWNEICNKLYVGDQLGLVMGFSISRVKVANFGRTSETILKKGSMVVQMDFRQDLLLISTTTKAIICYVTRELFQQVGSKPRDGIYGACFIQASPETSPVIYSSRPGSRIWEVDLQGQVLATHQFKELLSIPGTPIINCSEQVLFAPTPTSSPHSCNFPTIHSVKNRYIFTWSHRGIYVFDSSTGTVVQWSDEIREVQEVTLYGFNVYLLHLDGSITELALLSLKECLLLCYQREKWLQTAELACKHSEEVLHNVESFLAIDFHEVLWKLKEFEPDDLVPVHVLNDLQVLISGLESCHAEIRAKVQESLNQTFNEVITPTSTSDAGSEDNDEARSLMSDIASETSSIKTSLSRLSEVYLEDVVNRATSAIVTKVVGSGFMKKAVLEALQKTDSSPELTKSNTSSIDHLRYSLYETQSLPTTPRQTSPKMERAVSSANIGTTTKDNKQGSNSRDLIKKALSSTALSSLQGDQFVEMFKKPDHNYDTNKDEIQRQDPTNSKSSSGKTHKVKKRKPKLVEVDDPEFQEAENDPMIDHLVMNAVKTEVTTAAIPTSEITASKDLNEEGKSQVHHKVFERAKGLFKKIVPQDSFGDHAPLSDTFPGPLPDTFPHRNESKVYNIGRRDDAAKVQFQLKGPSNSTYIVNQIVDYTASIRGKLRDQRILYNVKTVRANLKDWATTMHSVSQEFINAISNDLEDKYRKHMTPVLSAYVDINGYKLLFSNLSFAFSEISNVAMLCFDSGIFGDTCSYLKGYEMDILTSDLSLKDIHLGGIEEIKRIDAMSDCIDNEETNIENEDHVLNVSLPESNDIDEGHFANSVDITLAQTMILPLESTNISNSLKKSESDSQKSEDSTSTLVSTSSKQSLVTESMTSSSLDLRRVEYLCEDFSLSNMDECKSCLLDESRACFILRYYPLLDTKRIRSMLHWKGGCKQRTWTALLAVLKEMHVNHRLQTAISSGIIPNVLLNLQNLNNVDAGLAMSSRLYKVSPTLLSTFLQDADVKPWEVALLYNLEPCLQKDPDSFLTYAVECLSQSAPPFHDKLFLYSSLVLALKQSPNRDVLFCQCGKPKPDSHNFDWKWKMLINNIIELVSQKYECKDPIILKFTECCRISGYWAGYINLLASANNLDGLLPLLTQLSDYFLLENLVLKGRIFLNEDHWHLLLSSTLALNTALEKADEHKCTLMSKELLFDMTEGLIWLCSQSIGATSSIKLLQSLCQSLGHLVSREFFRKVVRKLELQKQQRNIVSKLIEVESNRIWSNQKIFLSKEMETVRKKELAGEEVMINYSSKVDQGESGVERNEPYWGRSINISSEDCPICTLPLCLRSSSYGGLTVFQCGHIFHKVCVPENACLVCYHDELYL